MAARLLLVQDEVDVGVGDEKAKAAYRFPIPEAAAAIDSNSLIVLIYM
jgi:hypothetical protein